MKLPPLRFKPELVEKIWGGSRLICRNPSSTTEGCVGESWEISDYPGRETKVENGSHHGLSISDLFSRFGSDFSTSVPRGEEIRFPLLLKILDAQESLSLQVHPDDAIASQLEDQNGGKEEAWLILEARKGARLALGIKNGINRETFFEEIKRGNAGEVVNWIEVKRGDFVHIEPGLIHAVEPGILLMEIQQTSDATYRLHDWNRESRSVHLTEAAVAVKEHLSGNLSSVFSNSTESVLMCNTKNLRVTSHNVVGKHQLGISKATIVFCFEGKVSVSNKVGETTLYQYDSALLPACSKDVVIIGDGMLIEMSDGRKI